MEFIKSTISSKEFGILLIMILIQKKKNTLIKEIKSDYVINQISKKCFKLL